MEALGTPAETRVFGRVLDQTATSYKLFWLQALLTTVEKSIDVIQIRDLLSEMVVQAWHPVALYRLSLGHADRLQDAVSRLHKKAGLRPSAPLEKVRALAKTELVSELGHYVPYRFIAPWFETDLRNITEKQRTHRVRELAAERFGGPQSPSYCIETSLEGPQIRFDPSWRDWMLRNPAILRAFADRGLVQYLQARNPSVPGIPAKLRLPLHRDLTRGRRFWITAFPVLSAQGGSGSMRDIYTGADLGPSFSLDHFLPWTFVAHDLLWNLVPISPTINASKSDAVPDLDPYLPRLASLHHAALQSLREHPKLLVDVDSLTEQFNARFRPLAAEAQIASFATEWTLPGPH
jgi:hypothetical protein